jgi:hypothetical protein
MNNNKSPFCKVCFDSGKPDTKHWVKDRNNKVCCPTLLALKCRLCGQCGHTVKYCSKVSVAPPHSKVQAKPYKVDAPVVQKSKPEPKNKFDLLFSDSDEEQEQQEQEEQEEQQQPAIKRWVDYDTDSDDEQQEQKQEPVVKRWADYDTDSDDEVPLSVPLPKPTLKRYGHSDKSDDSLIEQESM